LPVTNPVQKPSGQQVPLLCSVEGVPNETRPGIVWSKHDGIDKTGNAEVKSLDHHTMSLLIKNATSDDSGVYTCQAQIGNRLLSRTVDVIIFGPLFIEFAFHWCTPFHNIRKTTEFNLRKSRL
uniref:Ig-like domain-containing protein n=1 Tax=Angiostrongylus costaricensis TaxID=334426 RepID=A0A0R3PZH7_ANGCS